MVAKIFLLLNAGLILAALSTLFIGCIVNVQFV